LLLLAATFVLVGGGGAAAYWFWSGHVRASEPPNTLSHVEPEGLLAMEPFLVNLADEGGHTYLRATLKLLLPTEGQAQALEKSDVRRSQLRSAILETLATEHGSRLVTPDGKLALKRTLIQRLSTLTPPVEVRDVLFSDFIVQF